MEVEGEGRGSGGGGRGGEGREGEEEGREGEEEGREGEDGSCCDKYIILFVQIYQSKRDVVFPYRAGLDPEDFADVAREVEDLTSGVSSSLQETISKIDMLSSLSLNKKDMFLLHSFPTYKHYSLIPTLHSPGVGAREWSMGMRKWNLRT